MKSRLRKNWKDGTFFKCGSQIKDIYHPNQNESIPYIGLEHIQQNTLALVDIGDSSSTVSNKFKFQKGDILFGKLRPYFRKVIIAEMDGVCSTDIFVVRSKENIDQKFLFYLMASQDFIDYSYRGSTGTRMPRAQWDFLGMYELKIPDFEEQKEISSILYLMDEKIRKLRRINKILLEIGNLIFKNSCKNFRIKSKFEEKDKTHFPKDWNIFQMSQIVKQVKIGIDPQKFPDDVFAHYSIPSFDKNMHPTMELGKEILSTKNLIPSECILISKINPKFSRIWFPIFNYEHKSLSSTEFLCLTIKDHMSLSFLYFLLNSENFYNVFTLLVTGTTGSHQRIKPENFFDLELLLPDSHVVDEFTKLIQPVLELLKNNIHQIFILEQLRDNLLPKIIFGEIRL